MVARGAGAAGPVLLACRQWDPLGLARRLPSLGVGAWRSAPLLPWRVQCPVRVGAALAAGSGGSGRYLVLCLSRFPHPAPRVPRCVWRAVPSGCPLPLPAGTPFRAVCAFRELGPGALLVVPACLLAVCALALPRRPLPPPLGGVACAPHAVPALGAGRAVPRGPCPSACPALVPCSVWRAWGGAVRSRFPPTWLGAVGVAEGRPRGGCLPLLRGVSEVRRSLSPDCPPTGRAVGVRYPRAVGAGVWVWGPNTVPLACTPCGGCVPRGWWAAVPLPGLGLCAPRQAGPWRSCAGGRAGGGGRPVCRAPCLCGRGGLLGGYSLCLVPSLCLPWAGNKAGVTGVVLVIGGVVPIPLRFVLARLHWVRSVWRPWALARARLVPAVPVGAGGLGGGAGRAPAPLSGGGRGDHPPCLGGWGPGPPRLAGRWGGGGGGGRAVASLLPLWGAARGSLPWPPSCRWRTPPRRARSVGVAGPPRGGGDEGRPMNRSPGGPCRPEPPICPLRLGNGHGRGQGGLGLHTALARRRAPPLRLVRAPLRRAGVGSPVGRDPRGSRRLRALGRAACRSSHIPPPRRVPSGGGGASPRLRGGGGSLL